VFQKLNHNKKILLLVAIVEQQTKSGSSCLPNKTRWVFGFIGPGVWTLTTPPVRQLLSCGMEFAYCCIVEMLHRWPIILQRLTRRLLTLCCRWITARVCTL